jgi:hypothetical protein
MMLCGGVMEKLHWIKELVLAEQQMEESGVVDFTAGFDPQVLLETQTLEFMNAMKSSFVEVASAFNQLKPSSLGHIKIYGISKTKADFMLFRNGYKLILSVRQPGLIGIRLHTLSSTYMPGAGASSEDQVDQGSEDYLKARWGAFGELNWTYKDHSVNTEYMVRYYTTRFLRESTR